MNREKVEPKELLMKNLREVELMNGEKAKLMELPTVAMKKLMQKLPREVELMNRERAEVKELLVQQWKRKISLEK